MRLHALLFAIAGSAVASMAAFDAEGASIDPFAEEAETEQAINRAVLLYREGDLVAAEEAARAFLLLNPTSARGYEVLGAILGQLGRAEDSLAALDTAVRLDPKLATAHANRAVLLAAKNDIAGARRALEEAIEIDPELRQAQARLGRILEIQGDLDGAARRYELSLEGAVEGADPGVRVNLAGIYNALGQYEQTIALLTPWQRDRAVEARLHVTLAEAMLALGRGTTALRQYRFAVEVAPDDPRARLGLGIAHRTLEDYPQALRIFRELQEQFPDSVAPVLQEADTLVEMDDRLRAESTFKRAMALAPGARIVELGYGRVLQSWDRAEDAKALYLAMIERDGADAEALAILAGAHRQLGETDLAKAAYARAVEAFPDDPAAYARYGLFLRELGDVSGALSVVEEGLTRHPGNQPLLRVAATSARDLNELRRAIRYGQQIIDQNPDSLDDRFIFATLLDKARADEQAIAMYRDIAERQRSNWAAMNNLALVLARNNEEQEALTYARRAIQLQPDNPAVQHTVGWVLYLNGRLGEAADLMEQSLEALPDVAEVRYHMGMIRLARGDRAGARLDLEAGLRLDPAHEEAPRARDILANEL
ncbi:MAG: tetratricopeptide repeat protein [Pseudomonadota bacterium]